MIRFLTICLLVLGSPVSAQEFPSRYSTVGVAADDQLNIRSAPSASSEIVSTYRPFTINIEVLQITADGKWGKVGVGERNAWVAMRYLERSDSANNLLHPISCSGTEPFWTLTLGARGDEFTSPDAPRLDLEATSETTATNGLHASLTGTDGSNYELLVKRGLCSDGMSDREFGWQSMLLRSTAVGKSVEHGCCTLDASR